MLPRSCSAGSAGVFSIVVRTSSSCLLYSAKANLVCVAPFTASLMFAGVTPALPTLLFFSTDLIINLLCLACGVDGAEGAWSGFCPIPGALWLFRLLVGASRKPSRSMPVAVIAAQVCLMAVLVTGGFTVLSCLSAGMACCWTLGLCRIWTFPEVGPFGGPGGFGGFSLRLSLLPPLLVGFMAGPLGVTGSCLLFSILFSICRSLISNLASMSLIMASIAPWVIAASKVSWGMPVGSGAVEG